MAAMNKAQAQRYKQKRTTDYGAEPGEVTSGQKPGDRVYDPDTNTWQQRDSGNIGSYIDEVMASSGLSDVQGSTSGNAETRRGKGGKSTEASTSGDEAAVNEAVAGGLPLEEIAGGALGAALALVAGKMIDKMRGTKGPKGGSQSTASSPATDTAGAADKGGPSAGADATGTDVVAAGPSDVAPIDDPNGIVDAVYDEQSGQYGLPPPQKQLADSVQELPPYNDVISAYQKGKQGAAPMNPDLPPAALEAPADAMDPEAADWVAKIKQLSSGSPIDATMNAVEGPDAPAVDPEMERALQSLAAQMAEQGNFGNLDPSVNPGLPNMDPYVMARLKAIISGL